MNLNSNTYDAVIIGGGFYGCNIAIYLAKQRGLKRVALIERESALLTRASYNNQARVHNGYHYPRSFTTAYRSRVNLPKFVRDWPSAIKKDFTKLYAIARRNSKVTAKQFERFCHEIGAQIQPANTEHRELFESRLIENVFIAEEFVFDSTKLADWARAELLECNVQVRFLASVTSISKGKDQTLLTSFKNNDGSEEILTSRNVFNCTYSGLNQFLGDFPGTLTGLKQEITEMPLIKVPAALEGLGITVMDGPFFSLMPFPSRNLHTLSHVRYTPHFNWEDKQGIDPYSNLNRYEQPSRVEHILRDVARYLPAISEAKHIDSLFEIKTVLVKNEQDDGRPILFEKHHQLPGCFSILGGKIDNIYDVIERLDDEKL